MKRVAFLYNHDAQHQVAHLAGMMGALTAEPGVHVTALFAKPAAEAVARGIVGPDVAARIDWVQLPLQRWVKRAAKLLDRLFPFRRLMVLRRNGDLFARHDAIVSSERTCLRIKDKLGAASPAMIHLPHGSGDRNVAHHPQLAEFDLHLMSGRKLVDVGHQFRLFTDNWRIVGYPKFDGVDLDARPRLFANDHPVVLYNPHFDPYLSSVYKQGEDVLALFARRPDLNLIFAPHVMYGRKRWHFSLEFARLKRRWSVSKAYLDCPNILIDLGSPASIDMTYTRAADVYLGDVSSQIYEFLERPRAAIFLKSHRIAWKDHPDYQFWHNGPVIDRVADLEPLLDRWPEVAAEYRAAQQRLFAYTIDMTGEPASVRGARAIADYARAR